MFEISPDQQEKLLIDGFVSLPNAVPSDLIDRWRELADRFEAEALDATHQRLFAAMLAEEVPLRPGVARVLSWAARGGVKLALVSRADLQPVSALLRATERARAGISFDVAVLRPEEPLAPLDLGATGERGASVEWQSPGGAAGSNPDRQCRCAVGVWPGRPFLVCG